MRRSHAGSRPPRSRRRPRRAAAAAAARRAPRRSLSVDGSATSTAPVTPFCAASCRSWAKTSRTCCSGTAPVNSGTGWPADEGDDHRDGLGAERLRELRVGVDVDLGEHQSSAGLERRPSRAPGLSCLHGPHHSAHRSMTTGTVRESSRTCGNVSSVTSITSDGTTRRRRRRRAAPAAAVAAGRFRRAERSTAPRRAAPEAASVT